MSQYVEIIALKNDRFDTIAWRAYADVSKMNLIIAENPQIGIVEGTIPEGTIVRIPVLDVAPTPTTTLPPWKQ